MDTESTFSITQDSWGDSGNVSNLSPLIRNGTRHSDSALSAPCNKESPKIKHNVRPSAPNRSSTANPARNHQIYLQGSAYVRKTVYLLLGQKIRLLFRLFNEQEHSTALHRYFLVRQSTGEHVARVPYDNSPDTSDMPNPVLAIIYTRLHLV